MNLSAILRLRKEATDVHQFKAASLRHRLEYSEVEVKKLAGKNFLRSASAVICAVLSACEVLGGPLGGPIDKRDWVEMNHVRFSMEFMGMHTLSPARHWPDVPFGSIRPAGTSWGALEPEKGQFDWHSLDTWVTQSESHHVQLDYVFVNTPRWASTRPDEPCPGGRFGCAAPPNVEAWSEFVTALVTRYKGKISSYEIWNEPNGSGFWTGTPKQMVELAAIAYPIIKRIDPSALVTTPAVSSSGWPLSHDAWLDQYLTAGGGDYADVIAWHGYAGRNDRPALPPEGLTEQIHALRKVLLKHGLSKLPVWNTEGGWGKDAQLPDESAQAAFLVKWYLINFTNGIARAYWYQWDNPDWGTLWRAGGGLTAAGNAARQVEEWLSGVSEAAPCRQMHGSAIWVCDLKKGRDLYHVVWSSTGDAKLQDTQDLVSITEIGGKPQPFDSRPVTVTSQPLLLKYSSAN
jgi:hypothetical protein